MSPGIKLPVPFCRGLVGPHSRSWRFGKQNIFLPVGIRNTDRPVSIPTKLPVSLHTNTHTHTHTHTYVHTYIHA